MDPIVIFVEYPAIWNKRKPWILERRCFRDGLNISVDKKTVFYNICRWIPARTNLDEDETLVISTLDHRLILETMQELENIDLSKRIEWITERARMTGMAFHYSHDFWAHRLYFNEAPDDFWNRFASQHSIPEGGK